MGEVFLAHNPGVNGIGKFVAIKKLLKEYGPNKRRTKLFRREAEVTIKLNHANIASTYEVGEHDGTLYIVMEYVPGVTLKQVFDRQIDGLVHLTTPDAIHIAISIASGLAYAQRFTDPITKLVSPVLHCDICPHNVLVSFDGDLKIIDFGVAKVLGQEASTTQSDSIIGKVKYISPERAQNLTVDSRSDVYSAGIILWELLSGKRYYEDDDFAIIRSHLLGERACKALPYHVEMADKLQPILEKMLANDPEKRFPSAEVLEKELRLFLNRHFPEYLPSQFRAAIQTGFAQEIIEHANLMSEFAGATAKPKAKTKSKSDELRPNPKISASAQDLALRATDAVSRPLPSVNAKKWDDSAYKHINVVQGPPPRKFNWFVIATVLGMLFTVGHMIYVRPWLRESFVDLFRSVSAERQLASLTNPSDPTPPNQKAPSWAVPQKKPLPVQLDSSPAGAEILVDGEVLGRTTPTSVPFEPGKNYRLHLRKAGFKDHIELFSYSGSRHVIVLRPDGIQAVTPPPSPRAPAAQSPAPKSKPKATKTKRSK